MVWPPRNECLRNKWLVYDPTEKNVHDRFFSIPTDGLKNREWRVLCSCLGFLKERKRHCQQERYFSLTFLELVRLTFFPVSFDS